MGSEMLKFRKKYSLPYSQRLIFRGLECGHPPLNAYVLFYESADCSGPPLMVNYGLLPVHLTANGGVRGTTLYYAQTSINMVVTRQSVSESPLSASECSKRSGIFTPPDICCESNPAFTDTIHPAGTLDLRAFVPPFHLEMQQ